MNKNFNAFKMAMLIKEMYSKTTCLMSDNLKDSGLTHQQIVVIKLIAHNKQMTISELCEEMSLSKGTVSGIVQRLERGGYLEKFKSEEDKRNTYVRFSKNGLKFANDFRQNINESFEKIFENCTNEELEEMIKSLTKILNKI
ncbi:DNA-binding transcriptional regulator, MarR family [Clostridium cavendishii DSM 21758]|uniref:DNA-binding transcriptional regulator, MarR family n=1 Tax=Clostridium cavendishii DSM 21758 TaxID=1121302 RepID=A0A1M6PQZ2_9CLOT|nr:MarR family transcriptional regulator [Clostridium cavendishii]SHK10394.1 DNA-binding transcriptional regulator, MarR family [Clostridium cavendishii DSM 21758]